MENPTTIDNPKQVFAEPENWDMEALYTDLASAKGKNLTPVEKRHLCALLCGHSPAEIAERLEKTLNGLEVDLSHTVYSYVKTLIGSCRGEKIEKLGNWQNISKWLEEAGYKTPQITESQLENLMPKDAKVHIESINISNDHEIEININVKLPLPSPPNSSK